MSKKIALITTGHPPFDERIYWKFALSISSNGYETAIFCSTENIDENKQNILLKGFKDDTLSRKERLNKLYNLIRNFGPDLIICCEVSAIIPAHKYKKTDNNKCKIVSDVTEWYPENVAGKKSGISAVLSYIILFFTNIILTNKCNYLIVGERNKLKRYKIISPFLSKMIIGYYPILQYFYYSQPANDKNSIVLCYAGLINFERGILKLIEAVEVFSRNHNEIKTEVIIIGKFQYENEEKQFNELSKQKINMNIELREWTSYDHVSDNLKDVDLCFDLRKRNFIYKNSLPIKIFEYMACGKPFVFTDIKPIREELKVDEFGILVDPDNINEIVVAIERYYNNPDLYLKHSQNCRKEIEDSKNWEAESIKLIKLIRNLT